MSRATYNIFDDKIRLALDHKPNEKEVSAMKQAGFSWWPGQNLNVCKWTPQAEDYILSLGIQLEEICEADDVQSRVQRFKGYAENAEAQAEQAQEYLEERANTARRRENAEKRIANETSRAAHWQRRIAGAIANRAYKDSPDVIERRIKKLRAEQRKQEKGKKTVQAFLGAWEKCNSLEQAKYIANYDHAGHDFMPDHLSLWCAIDQGLLTDYKKAAEFCIEHHEKSIVWHDRWIEHLAKRIEFETAMLEAAKCV